MDSITSCAKASMNFTSIAEKPSYASSASSSGDHASVRTDSSSLLFVYWPERRLKSFHRRFTSGQSPLTPASK
jgi:hypothetical protein